MAFFTLRSAYLLFFALGLLGCPKRPESVDQNVPYSDGADTSTGSRFPARPRQEIRDDARADAALSDARARAQTRSRRQQTDALFAVWKAFPATHAGEDALYDSGSMAFDAKDYPTARKAFNELLFENPLYPRANEAKERLGLSSLETHAYRDAYQTLSSLAEHATGPDKKRLLEEVGRAAEGAQVWTPALDNALKAAEDASSQEEREAALARVTELIDSKIPFLDIAKAQQELQPSHPAWPLLTFKLGRIYYHLRDWTHLREILGSLLTQAPQHPFAIPAREMLARAGQTGHANPLTVGALLPMTGPYKAWGEAALRSIHLALKNSPVELVVKDTQGDVTLAAKGMEELALDDGAIAVLGPLLGEDSKRAAISAEELGVPLLTLTKADGITDVGPHIFRNMLTVPAQTTALVDYAMKTLGFKSFALLYPNSPVPKMFANDFWNDVLARGGEVRGAETYTDDQTTFTHEVQRLVGRYYLDDRRDFVEARQEVHKSDADSFRKKKALEKIKSKLEPVVDFDAIFLPDRWDRVSLVAPALAVEDIITNGCDEKEIEKLKKTTDKEDVKTVTLLGVTTWASPKGQSGLPGLLERGTKFVHCAVYVDGFFADSERPATRHFVKLYGDAYKDQPAPGLLEAMAYDSAKIFRNIIDQHKPATREDFRTALSEMKNFDGATGKTSFNDKREAEKTLFLLSVQADGIHEIKPEAKKASM